MKRILHTRVLRWALLNGITLLVLMSILRLVFTFRFHPVSFSWKQSLPAFWLGLRFDLRVACIVTLLIWLLASIPFFNPFKHTAAKKFWLGFMLTSPSGSMPLLLTTQKMLLYLQEWYGKPIP
jgi:hypothetical protein